MSTEHQEGIPVNPVDLIDQTDSILSAAETQEGKNWKQMGDESNITLDYTLEDGTSIPLQLWFSDNNDNDNIDKVKISFGTSELLGNVGTVVTLEDSMKTENGFFDDITVKYVDEREIALHSEGDDKYYDSFTLVSDALTGNSPLSGLNSIYRFFFPNTTKFEGQDTDKDGDYDSWDYTTIKGLWGWNTNTENYAQEVSNISLLNQTLTSIVDGLIQDLGIKK